MTSNCKLCLRVAIVSVAVLILVGCGGEESEQTGHKLPSTSAEVVTQRSTDWPMFRFSLDRAGYNPNETRLKPPLVLKWEYKTDNQI